MRLQCREVEKYWRLSSQVRAIMALMYSIQLDSLTGQIDSLFGALLAGSSQGACQCRTLKGETPLFLAVVYGLRGNATFLIQNGCDPDLQNDEQDSPLVAGEVCMFLCTVKSIQGLKSSRFMH